MGLKGRPKRLERLSEGGVVSIPQRGGGVARFPASDLEAAFLHLSDRFGAGEDAPPEYPLVEAVRDSSDPKWSGTFFATDEDVTAPVEDLSE